MTNDANSMVVTRSLAMSQTPSGGLICVSGENIGVMIPLPGDKRVRIGRDSSVCEFVISDAKVSRTHCEIVYMPAVKKYRITDLSSNGTFREDGSRLEKGKEYYFNPGEQVLIGKNSGVYKLL